MTGHARIEPRWIEPAVALAVHERQLAEHGGPVGVRDRAMLESALARPRNAWAYGEDDRAALAAAYAYGIVRNHAFVDGNKRTGWVMARLFLALNGVAIRFTAPEAIAVVMLLAAGDMDETTLAGWFRERVVDGG